MLGPDFSFATSLPQFHEFFILVGIVGLLGLGLWVGDLNYRLLWPMIFLLDVFVDFERWPVSHSDGHVQFIRLNFTASCLHSWVGDYGRCGREYDRDRLLQRRRGYHILVIDRPQLFQEIPSLLGWRNHSWFQLLVDIELPFGWCNHRGNFAERLKWMLSLHHFLQAKNSLDMKLLWLVFYYLLPQILQRRIRGTGYLLLRLIRNLHVICGICGRENDKWISCVK